MRPPAWIAMIGIAAYVVLVGGAWLGILLPELRIVTVATAAVLLGAWALVARHATEWRPRSLLMPAIVAALVSLTVSTVFSRYPRVSLEYLGYAVVLAGLYLLLVRLMADAYFRPRLVSLATVFFFVISVSYVGLCVWRWLEWWDVVGRFVTPPLRPEFESYVYGNPSAVLTIAALLAIPAIATSRSSKTIDAVVVAIVLLLLGGVALLSGSRSGWFGIGLAVVAGLLVAASSGRLQAGLQAARRRVGLSMGAFAVVALVAVAVGPGVLQRLGEGGLTNRPAFLRIGFELFAESPVVGTGLGSWVVERVGHTRPEDADEYVPHAHNIFVQTLAEQGVVGLAAGVAVAAALFLLLRRGLSSQLPSTRRWAFVTLVGLVSFAAHQLFDFYPNMPAVLLAAAIPIAYLDSALQAEHRPLAIPRPAARLANVGGVAMTAIAILMLFRHEMPAVRNAAAVQLANEGRWEDADAGARTAAAEDPAISPYLFTAGLTSAHQGDHGAAEHYFSIVAERDDLPEAWLNLAAERAELEQTADAVAALHEALRLGDQRPAVAMPAGDLALRLGATDLAIEAFTAAILANLSLAGDPWWADDPARASAFQHAIERANAAMSPSARWELALMTGDADSALALAAQAQDPLVAAGIVRAWTGDEAARSSLLEHCRSEPRDVGALAWCARVESRFGSTETAADFRYIATVQNVAIYSATSELRVDTTPETAYPVLDGGAATSWGAFTYRRSTTLDMLVPGLLRLTLD